MAGGATPRRKGDNFERLVKKLLISKGFFCVRQPRSAFPDLIAVRKVISALLPETLGYEISNIIKENRNPELFFIECKMCKYLSQQEKSDLKRLAEKFAGTALVAYIGPGKEIKFCDLNNQDIVL